MKLTISELADMAKVSKSTISKALNGHKGVSQATRERIMALAEHLDFQPDASARALAMQKTNIIGLLIPHESMALSENYWPAVLAGVSRRSTLADLNLMVLTPPMEGDIRPTINQILKRNSVDGLIIGSDMLDKESYSRLIIAGLPFVLLGQNPELGHYCVDVDSRQGTALMMDHLLGKGYRRIAMLMGPDRYPYNQERRATYHDCLEKAGISWRAEACSDYNQEDNRRALLGLLHDHADMDCLFVAAGGQFLLDSLQVLRSEGIDLARLGIGTFDDYNFLDYMEPRVPAVRQPAQEAGAAAVDMLLEILAGREPAATMVRLGTVLVPR